MEARILLAADFANVDSSGKLNIIGAFNRLLVVSFPIIHPSMYLVIRLAAELGELETPRTLRVILNDEDGQEEWRTPDINFTIPHPTDGRTAEFNPIIALNQMRFDKPGRHEFKVYVNGDWKGDIPIDLVKIAPPQVNRNVSKSRAAS
jgi:hypothetical protein